MSVVGTAKDIYLEKFGLDATMFSMLEPASVPKILLTWASVTAACTGDGGFFLDPCAGHFRPSVTSYRDVGKGSQLQSEANRHLHSSIDAVGMSTHHGRHLPACLPCLPACLLTYMNTRDAHTHRQILYATVAPSACSRRRRHLSRSLSFFVCLSATCLCVCLCLSHPVSLQLSHKCIAFMCKGVTV